MLGDSYGAAVVAALSKKELMAMDELNAKMKEREDEKTARNGNDKVAYHIIERAIESKAQYRLYLKLRLFRLLVCY